MLDREAILAKNDLKTEVVKIPEWDDEVTVRTLTGKARDEFESALQDATRAGGKIDMRGLKARLVVCSVCDAEGKLLFSIEDIPTLNEKSAAAIDRIFQVAQRLSGFTAEDVEELAGNSGGDRSDSSGSS